MRAFQVKGAAECKGQRGCIRSLGNLCVSWKWSDKECVSSVKSVLRSDGRKKGLMNFIYFIVISDDKRIETKCIAFKLMGTWDNLLLLFSC